MQIELLIEASLCTYKCAKFRSAKTMHRELTAEKRHFKIAQYFMPRGQTFDYKSNSHGVLESSSYPCPIDLGGWTVFFWMFSLEARVT